MPNPHLPAAGALRLFRTGLLVTSLAAFLLPASLAGASLSASLPARTGHSRVESPQDVRIELAGKRGSSESKPPARGSSAELNGGTSADRYGGSSADRRGVAGRFDNRNRSVRQFSASNRKRNQDHHSDKKNDDELNDQDQDPPRDLFTFAPADPTASRDRGDRD